MYYTPEQIEKLGYDWSSNCGPIDKPTAAQLQKYGIKHGIPYEKHETEVKAFRLHDSNWTIVRKKGD